MPETHDLGRAFAQYARVPKDAPAIQRGVTRETEGDYRVGTSVVIQLPLRRESRWFGILLSWLSIQVKLPIGPKMERSRHGFVVGWWRYKMEEEWSALLAAIRMGEDPDGDDERNFTDPTSESISGTLRDVAERRVDVPGDDRADG